VAGQYDSNLDIFMKKNL